MWWRDFRLIHALDFGVLAQPSVSVSGDNRAISVAPVALAPQERQRSLSFEAASPADRAVNADPIVHRLWAGVVFGCGGPGFVFLAPECTH